MTSRGLKVHSINSDGDCLYSSVSHQLEKYGIKKNAQELRKLTVDTIKSNSDDFIGFLEEDIDTYCNKVRIRNLKIFKGSNPTSKIYETIIFC